MAKIRVFNPAPPVGVKLEDVFTSPDPAAFLERILSDPGNYADVDLPSVELKPAAPKRKRRSARHD